MKDQSINPKDILPDGVDSAIINGRLVRKGTVAAYLSNIDMLENPQATSEQQKSALATLTMLAEDVVAIGLHKHVTFKNEAAERLLVLAEKAST